MASDLLRSRANGAEALASQRLENLRDTLDYVCRHSPLYKRKLAGLDPDSFVTAEDIQRLPFTTRSDLQERAPFGTLCTDARPQAYYESSGTSGSPVPGFPDLSDEKARSFGTFLNTWMGLSQARVKKALLSLAFEMNPTGARFQMALPYAGVMVLPTGVRSTICPPEKLIDILHRLEPEAIFGRPFELLRYGDALNAKGTPPSETKVVKLFMLGEVVSLGKWERIRKLWDDADLYGHYGLTEVDAGLQTCSQAVYHEPASPFLLTEIIEPHSPNPTPVGEWGEVVFTTLRRSHAPLIRYRTGDLGRQLALPCSCGNPSPCYEIKGRLRDAHNVGTGTPLFPVDLENLIYLNPDIGHEYLFIIEADNTIRIVVERALGSCASLEDLSSKLIQASGDTLGFAPQVEVRSFGRISDKLGIAKKKSGQFTDLRGLSDKERQYELEINVVDSNSLRGPGGRAIAI